MKILLFDVNGYVLGVRGIDLIAAILKKSDHDIKKVSLIRKEAYKYNDKELLQLSEIILESDLVMISVYSNHVDRAIQITKLSKQINPKIIVVWGGPHCIAAPELNLDIADIVCYSEGEQIINDLVECIKGNLDLSNIANIAYKKNGSIIKNSLAPPISDLDSLPLSDHDFNTHYILGDKLEKTSDIDINTFYEKINEQPMLAILTIRGCPIKCSYCSNSKQLELFGKSYIRKRSINNYIDEIKILSKLYNAEHVGFADDDFLMRSLDELEEFIERYNKEINLPFSIFLSPASFSKEKMDILVKGKLVRVRYGVQSGSIRILKDIYNRHHSLEKTLSVLNDFKYYALKFNITLNVNFIIDNPYETPSDIYKTFKIILRLPRYYKIKILNLVFFPGTPIYQRAINDGIIKENDPSIFRSFNSNVIYQKNYITYLIKAYGKTKKLSAIKQSIYKLLGFGPIYYLSSFILNPIVKYIFNKRLKNETTFYS